MTSPDTINQKEGLEERINYKRLEGHRKELIDRIKFVLFLDIILIVPINIWVLLSNIFYKEFYFEIILSINMFNLVILLYYFSYKIKQYRKKFRKDSLPLLFHEYDEEDRHRYKDFFAHRIQNTYLYDRIDQLKSENIITGMLASAEIIRADVQLGSITYFSNRRRKYIPLCHGHWYIINLDTNYNGITHINQRKKGDTYKSYERPNLDDSRFDEVKLQNRKFNEVYEVFSTDHQSARQNLTENSMDYLLQLDARYPGKVTVALLNHTLHIGIHHYKKRFKPPVFKKIKQQVINDQLEEVEIIKNLIEELNK